MKKIILNFILAGLFVGGSTGLPPLKFWDGQIVNEAPLTQSGVPTMKFKDGKIVQAEKPKLVSPKHGAERLMTNSKLTSTNLVVEAPAPVQKKSELPIWFIISYQVFASVIAIVVWHKYVRHWFTKSQGSHQKHS